MYKRQRGTITAASVIGCIAGLQLGAFSVTIETLLSGITELPFAVFLGMMQPIHLAIGLVEGLMTAAVLVFIYEARPEILYGYERADRKAAGRMSRRGTIAALAMLTLVIGGVISLFASGYPDGLEWSMEKVAGTAELAASGSVYQIAEKLQGMTAFLPDYAFKASDSAAGTSVSGIFGGVAVLAVCVCVCVLIKKMKYKKR